jgi:hypothetical protein
MQNGDVTEEGSNCSNSFWARICDVYRSSSIGGRIKLGYKGPDIYRKRA